MMLGDPTFSPTIGVHRSLYIHVPFCQHRCGYCNFALVAGRDDLIERYLSAIETEIGWLNQRQTVQTIFLGGGTPSYLSPSQLRRLFSAIRDKFDFEAGCEITAECNPNDLDDSKIAALIEEGVNRFSLGVQSFNSVKLRFLQRNHDRADIERAVERLDNFAVIYSFDLIFATENEQLCDWESDLQMAVQLNPQHLSTYELTIEKGTQFWNRHHHRLLESPDDEERARFYLRTIDFLNQSGWEHYEVSSFCRPGYRCQHNESYWSGQQYFAFGPGAARYIDGTRETNHRSTTTYLKRIEQHLSPTQDRQVLTEREQAIDYIIFGLRQIAGFNTVVFEQRFKRSIESIIGSEHPLFQNGLLEYDGSILKVTNKGLLLYDTIAEALFELNR